MKDNPKNEKQLDQKSNENKDNPKKNSVKSPKKLDKKNSKDSLSSPEEKSMNQKYFPSKEDFFGVKMSPEKKNLSSYSPHPNSPILNYFSGLSAHDENIYSPTKNYFDNNNNYFRKFSPNFESNPSKFFNEKFSNQNPGNINMEESQSLQERMAPFVSQGDPNNFVNQNIFQGFNANNMYQINNNRENEEEEEEESEQEAFTLTFNNLNNKESMEHNKETQNIKKNSIINKDNINNSEEIKESKEKHYYKNTEKKLNSSSSSKDNQVKNTINKIEYKPYIPNRFKDMPNTFNYPQESFQNNNFYNQYHNYVNVNQNFNNFYDYNNWDLPNANDEKQKRTQNFYYKGDNYQINNDKDNKKEDYKKTGKIPSITQEDIVTTITSSNKVIKRINPNVYLNESLEYLAFNILPLSQDQAGCRFLQEKIESDPKASVKLFFNNLLPNIISIMKDSFGNYLVQKLYPYLSPEEFNTILEKISNDIFDLCSSNHSTKCIQNIINYLSNPDLVKKFLNIIKPHIISLLKDMHGVHIVNKFIYLHPECAYDINKIIIENCSILATHKHGCFFLQKILEGPDKPLKSELIKNLIDNCFVLIIDQFGNYVIQSILHLKNYKYCSDIALIISENAHYYSKHKYSCNVIEKCFDFCGKKERNILLEKLSTPEVISELILDEHGNYVIQKALYYAEGDKKEEILKIISSMIPKIRNTSFGDTLLNRLFYSYPELNALNNYGQYFGNVYQNNWNYMNYGFFNRMHRGYQKRSNNNYINKFNNQEKENFTMKNKYDLINNDINYNNKEMKNNNNNNSSINNIYNINNNTINININSNIEKNEDKKNKTDKNKNENNNKKNNIKIDNFNLLPEPKKKKKKKKGKKEKKPNNEGNTNNLDNNNNGSI